jgi:tRNA (mo5U34)-methyltransferase
MIASPIVQQGALDLVMDSKTDLKALRAEVGGIPWWHTIDLGNGIITPGIDDSPRKLQRLRLPQDLTGKSVLDIGAWDGFFSFEAERRGASRVLALDSYAWNGSTWGSKRGFELARRVLGSRVEDIEMEVLDISPQTVGVFDVVFYLGVLYHMRHPLLALARIAAVTRELLVLETVVDLLSIHRPAMAIYPDGALYGDPSNWNGINPPALQAMLREAGFKRIEIVQKPDLFPKRFSRALYYRLKPGSPRGPIMHISRITLHAYK